MQERNNTSLYLKRPGVVADAWTAETPPRHFVDAPAQNKAGAAPDTDIAPIAKVDTAAEPEALVNNAEQERVHRRPLAADSPVILRSYSSLRRDTEQTSSLQDRWSYRATPAQASLPNPPPPPIHGTNQQSWTTSTPNSQNHQPDSTTTSRHSPASITNNNPRHSPTTTTSNNPG